MDLNKTKIHTVTLYEIHYTQWLHYNAIVGVHREKNPVL